MYHVYTSGVEELTFLGHTKITRLAYINLYPGNPSLKFIKGLPGSDAEALAKNAKVPFIPLDDMEQG